MTSGDDSPFPKKVATLLPKLNFNTKKKNKKKKKKKKKKKTALYTKINLQTFVMI